jgi:hypothetical protein
VSSEHRFVQIVAHLDLLLGLDSDGKTWQWAQRDGVHAWVECAPRFVTGSDEDAAAWERTRRVRGSR